MNAKELTAALNAARVLPVVDDGLEGVITLVLQVPGDRDKPGPNAAVYIFNKETQAWEWKEWSY